jgi:hypothetical protein
MSLRQRLGALERFGNAEPQQIQVWHGDQLDRVIVVDPLVRKVLREEYPEGAA